ncbi:heat shock protein 75 kDa, mitochondrial [Hyalella azteca]|uniref:Heat shock protein 83 n=1 Tax=Hyalella azteca TaxID=294128 RepID=A0A8B7NXN5_HYAAZ|nr:heat shock protein 75 kDa, mitochondrial [Hyalella azteca]
MISSGKSCSHLRRYSSCFRVCGLVRPISNVNNATSFRSLVSAPPSQRQTKLAKINKIVVTPRFAACVRQQQYCYSTAQEEASEPSSSNSPSSLSGELHQFQAETRMLLDIVAKSLYSDKEVFVRELVSNASDAIEKARYESVQGKGAVLGEKDLRISISTDKYNKTLTIQDSGIGMTKEELISNLGTIARSGSKAFVEQMKGGASSEDPSSIIGQFGVGFYSAFMVAERVDVLTRTRGHDAVGYKWSSDGCGSYTVEECPEAEPGTQVICHLKVQDREFSDEDTIKRVLKKYSSFVGAPIEVNGEQVNTIKPLWLLDPKEVKEEDHNEFYRFVGQSYDNPRFILHYRTDAPINLRCVLYFPEGKPGLFELTRDSVEGGVALYCRRVLIKNKAESVMPKWLRFVKGVVDSEDIPLNLSREMLQDSAVIRKVRTVLQNRCVRFLQDKLRKDPKSYIDFFNDYGIFLKEGIISSSEQMEKEEIARLLVYESSSRPSGERISLTEYIAKMPETQQDVYYLAAPSRELAEQSPYFEALKKRGVDVLFCYESYDEVVLMQLRQVNGKNIVSAEKDMRRDKDEAKYDDEKGLGKLETSGLMDYLKETLAGKCYGVKTTSRLVAHPCVVTVEEMASARHFVRTQFSQIPEHTRFSLLQPTLEINPSHPVIVKLNKLRTSNPDLAALVAKQLFSNALVIAGLVDDPRTVVTNMNALLEKALDKH